MVGKLSQSVGCVSRPFTFGLRSHIIVAYQCLVGDAILAENLCLFPRENFYRLSTSEEVMLLSPGLWSAYRQFSPMRKTSNIHSRAHGIKLIVLLGVFRPCRRLVEGISFQPCLSILWQHPGTVEMWRQVGHGSRGMFRPIARPVVWARKITTHGVYFDVCVQCFSGKFCTLNKCKFGNNRRWKTALDWSKLWEGKNKSNCQWKSARIVNTESGEISNMWIGRIQGTISCRVLISRRVCSRTRKEWCPMTVPCSELTQLWKVTCDFLSRVEIQIPQLRMLTKRFNEWLQL